MGTVVRYSIIFGRPIGSSKKQGFHFFWAAWWTGDPTKNFDLRPDASGGAIGREDVPELVRLHAERFVQDFELVKIGPAWAEAWRKGIPPEPVTRQPRQRRPPPMPLATHLECWDFEIPGLEGRGMPWTVKVLRWGHTSVRVELRMYSSDTRTVIVKKAKCSPYALKEYGCAKTEWGPYVHLPDSFRVGCHPHQANRAEREKRNPGYFVEEARLEAERDRRSREFWAQVRSVASGSPVQNQHLAALGLGSSATEADVNQAFRKLAFKAHPDRGGTHEAFIKLQRDRDAALAALRGEPRFIFFR